MKIIYTIILFLWITVLVNAQIDIEINNNMLVETSGGLFIEVSGDVVENGTGYLKGVVSSGSRTNETEFAGLTLGNGFTGTIKRTTGTALSTAPKSFLRSFNFNNTGSALNTTVQSEFVSTGSNDEKNGITTPFIYKKVGTNLSGYNNTSSTPNTIISAANVNIPTGISDITIAEGIGVAARVFLQGPYTSNAMSPSINSIILDVSPYSEDPRTAQNIPANAVDWVLVSLRSSTSPFGVLASRSAFVNSDGYIIDDLGNLHTGVPAAVDGSYNISIKHRNHLQIMTSSPEILDWESN
ncbi:MAG: hypothetical protein IPM32_06535 [Ignavibacteriae bacterium]|nr:hypothetical protein [Ignavibacteriota bacterium]